MSDPFNNPAPKFVDCGLSTIVALDKSASLCTLATIFGRPTDVTHRSAADHILGITIAVRDDVSAKSDYNHKIDF